MANTFKDNLENRLKRINKINRQTRIESTKLSGTLRSKTWGFKEDPSKTDRSGEDPLLSRKGAKKELRDFI